MDSGILVSEIEEKIEGAQLEAENIKRKLANEKIPPGKKEKLCYRLSVLLQQVIPSFRKSLELY